MRPTLSVIVTVLNEESSIDGLLNALDLQSLQPIEVIIVDGGSTDTTLHILHNAAKRNPHLKIMKKPGNRSQGRNTAMQHARGQLIAITDAGCIPHVDWLEELWKAFQIARNKTDKKIVVAGYYDAQTTSPFTEAVVPYALVMPDRIEADSFLPATRSMLIEKTAWFAVGGFDEHLSDNEDYAFARKLQAKPDIYLTFTDQAKVTWLPRTTLQSFWQMIFRFARGDIQAGIIRPKVLLIFARYLVGGLLFLSLLSIGMPIFLTVFMGVIIIYSLWAISKNKKYTPRGWYWLPILQIVSDIAVMTGSIAGLFSR